MIIKYIYIIFFNNKKDTYDNNSNNEFEIVICFSFLSYVLI